MVKIKLNENQLNNLFEYHSQQKLPFKDEYGNIDYINSKKNAIENYIDWIEEYGKVGSLGKSSIDFIQGFKSGFDKAFSWYKSNYSRNDEDEFYIKQKFYKSFSRYGFYYVPESGGWATDCEFNEMGNMYVERAIKLSGYNIGDAIGDDMFYDLIDRYQDNVGGCWSWKKGRAMAYCGDSAGGSSILIRGWIRLDDIDWVETVYINSYNMNSECEIRVKPNAKVELFDILGTFNSHEDFYYDEDNDIYGSYDDYGSDNNVYKVNLGGRHIIVNSTYFGNNGKYNKEGYAEIYDSLSSEQKYMDRQGNIVTKNDILNKRLNLLRRKIESLHDENKDKSYSELFKIVREIPGTSLSLIYDSGKYFFLDDMDNDKFVGEMFFDDVIVYFDCFKVCSNKKYNILMHKGNLLFDEWYDDISKYFSDTFFVYNGELNKWAMKNSKVNTDFIYDDVSRISNVNPHCNINYRLEYAEITIDGWVNFIDSDGELLSPNRWFLSNDYRFINENGKDLIETYDSKTDQYLFIDVLSGKVIDSKNVLDL